jgi:N-acetylglucosaminyldiphosphoundecaprenol N-acetyl-beta-D-mannosaminyltransferase
MLNTSCSTVAVLGVPFHNVTMEEALAAIEEQIREGGFHQVATANVDFLNNAMRNRQLHQILCSCDLIVPDGMPVVWMAKLAGSPLKERVSGVDLVERLAAVSSRRGYGVFLLGASDSSSQRAARVLRQRYPDLRIVGRYSPPPGPLETMNHEEILRRIEAAEPEILLVALGNPKQEQWLAMHRDRLRVPVCIGIGGTLDFLSGTIARAPQWVQQAGMEWLYRVCHEPRRLIGRYASDALCLFRHLPASLAALAFQPRCRAIKPGIQVHQVGNTKLISVVGDLTGETLQQFGDCSRDACVEGMNVVLDFSRTGYLGTDSLGSLIHLESRMRHRPEQLWLAAVPAHLSRILRTVRLQSYFMTTKIVSDALYRTAKAEQRLLASFSPDWYALRDEGVLVDVRMELLQDVCRRILPTRESEDSNLVPAAFASVNQ